MAKRGRQTYDQIAFDKSNGYYKVNIGKELRVDGKLTSKKFYLDTDKDKATVKKAHIVVEWTKIKASGGTYWTEEAYRNLEQQGAILPRTPKLRNDDAFAMSVEPLESKELQPFQTDKGAIDITQGVALMQLGAQKFMALPQVRGSIWAEWQKAVKEGRGWGLIKEFCATFGWNGKDAAALLMNNYGPMTIAPMGYDTTSTKKNDAKEQELIDGGILKPKTGDDEG